MDPTVAPGENSPITALDGQFFDVIGYQLDGEGVTTDLAITKSAGFAATYTIEATNLGPTDVVGAVIADSFPAGVSGVTWTCAATGGASCTGSGTGDLSDTVDLPVGGTVTYTATGSLDSGPANTATISPPAGATDSDSSNDSATGPPPSP